MIEKLFRNDISRARWVRFRRNRFAVGALVFVTCLLFISLTAELWANRKPLVMKYHGRMYYPVFQSYPASAFGRDDIMVMDYKQLQLREEDWALWPIVRWDPFERNDRLSEVPSRPSPTNWLGTDEGGRDVLARILYGFRYSIAYAVVTWFFASLLGAIAGAIMGFRGGWVDLVGQRIIEVVESLPYLIILITLVSIFKPSFWLISFLTVIFSWVTVSVYFRAEFLKLRRREFVEAARGIGSGRARLIFGHLLPNSLTPWIALSPFIIAGHISGLAALDFLGFGLPAPTPSWGELLNEALKNFRQAWWLAVFPSFALCLTLAALTLIGEAVRDALDPQ